MKRWIQSFAGAFAIATLAALLIRLFLVEDLRIASDSMYPSLWSGDLVVVTKFDFNLHLPFSTYELVKFRAPKRSEVVAFSLPDRGMQTFVKRVVAVGGDRVSVIKGELIVNGVPAHYSPYLESDSLSHPPGTILSWEETAPGIRYGVERNDASSRKDYGPVDVPPGHFFALGDNRVESNDSRIWGPIPYSCLRGKVALVWLSMGPKGNFRRERAGLRLNPLIAR